MSGVTPLPYSVEDALHRLCELKKQPQPDDGVRRKLSLLTEQEALYVLQQIQLSRAPIKKSLGAFIVFMIAKLHSMPTLHRSQEITNGVYGFQHQDYDRESRYSSPSSSQSCSSSPTVSDATFYSTFQSRGETLNPSVVATARDGQSPPSPYDILTAPSDTYRQLCENFQGVHISPSRSQSASPVTLVQLYKSFQGESATRSPVLYRPEEHGQAHLAALGELDFRKHFLILSYAGRTKLKDVIEADDIRDWKNLPMVKFETIVWHFLAEDNVGRADRLLNVDWDSGRTHFYECQVTRDGSYTFKGPNIKNERRTLLQKISGDDNVLQVKFHGEGIKIGSRKFYDNDYFTYMKNEREGIFVGLRRYRFFGYKDGGKVEKIRSPSSSSVKCYFVRVSSNSAIDRDVDYWLSCRSLHEGRRLIMHFHTLPSVDKFTARYALMYHQNFSPASLRRLVTYEKFVGESGCLSFFPRRQAWSWIGYS